MCAEASVKGNPLLAPRNVYQVKNVKAALKRLEYPEDQRALLEYHAMIHPKTLPDCRTYAGKKYAVCVLPQMAEHVKQVVRACGSITLNYDTTFDCGQFYLSILTFRHPLFEEEPVIPLILLFHEGKEAIGHSMLFEYLKMAIPTLDNQRTVFISDREASFKTVRPRFFQKAQSAFCHLHILGVRYVFSLID